MCLATTTTVACNVLNDVHSCDPIIGSHNLRNLALPYLAPPSKTKPSCSVVVHCALGGKDTPLGTCTSTHRGQSVRNIRGCSAPACRPRRSPRTWCLVRSQDRSKRTPGVCGPASGSYKKISTSRKRYCMAPFPQCDVR